MQYWILAVFRFREKAPLGRLLVLIRRNSVWNNYFDQLTAKKIFSRIREKWRWESSLTSAGQFHSRFEKSQFGGHGRCTSNRPKSGYARPFGLIFVLGAAHVHGEQVGHLTSDPPPLSETAMAVCVQKHVFRNDLLTHPTNPEVAACQAPVFGLRFVVSVSTVYGDNLASGFGIFRALFLCQARLGALFMLRSF